MSRTNVSRRGLLGGLAATGALAASGGFASPGAASAAGTTDVGTLPSTVDVAIVGGGISGLVAARDLNRSGRSVVVLEARDRVGGRVLNHTLTGGAVIESGGAFVGPTQDHILALAGELGVPTFKEYDQATMSTFRTEPPPGTPERSRPTRRSCRMQRSCKPRSTRCPRKSR